MDSGKSSTGNYKEQVRALGEELYIESMRSGERERLNLRVDAEYWDEKARQLLACRKEKIE